jgi:hypothetical protein
MRFCQFVAITWLALVCTGMAARAEKRVALVVGNGAYRHADRLTNPVNDARSVRDILKSPQLGFEVVYGENLDQKGLRQAIGQFASAVNGADVALVYFAGHGATFGDTPYVAPVDAEYANLEQVPYELIPLETLIGELRRAKGVRIAILDACRDNGAERELKRTRGSGEVRGLAPPKNPEGLILAYATQYLATAADNAGNGNSPFTAALLNNMATPGLDVKDMFFKVGRDVVAATGGQQRPEISISFYEQYALVPAGVAPPAMLPPTMPPLAMPPAKLPPATAGARCPAEERLRSAEGNTKTYMNFANRTGQPIRTYWLNYEGQRQYYAEIQAGATLRQPTFLTHPWVITDARDNCLQILMPQAQETTHSIF